MKILSMLYNLVFLTGFIIYLPVYIWRRKVSFQALKEKFGFIEKNTETETIWIQVVSVGEVNLIAGLLKRLKEIYNYPIIISTTTLTGNRLAKKRYSDIAKVIFFPLDLSLVIKKVLRIINPNIFIAVETELWPNLFRQLNKKNIPIIVINGRISDKAFGRYKLVKPLIKKVINRCGYIGVQNEKYKERFLTLGAKETKLKITGNMKLESIIVDEKYLAKIKDKYFNYLKKDNHLLLIAASTHSPEEEIILDIYKDISKTIGNLQLLIAPRHPQRAGTVEKIIVNKGFQVAKMSEIINYQNKNNSIFLLDTIGELIYLYSLCDICFVGGSLSGHGGHNILEPIYFLKPTVFGSDMSNFFDIERLVLEKSAGIKVDDLHQLKKTLLELIQDKALRDKLRDRSMEVFEAEKQSLHNNIQLIVGSLSSKIR